MQGKVKGILAVIVTVLVVFSGFISGRALVELVGPEVPTVEIALEPTALGAPLSEVKRDFKEFINKTYMPSENSTKEEYVESIAKYLSEQEYNRLLRDIGEYSSSIETMVSNLTINYGLAANNSDNCDKILCSFYLIKSANGVSVRNKTNLIFTIQGGEITNFSVYTGGTERKG